MKRDDLIDEHISGNKWRKLRYNLKDALLHDHHTILTFGGAFSNHIAATAHACYKAGMDGIGVIRGEDDKENPSIQFAREQGMELYFVSRTDYRKKTEPDFINNLKERFGRFYLVPEGGGNGLGAKGCAEILPEVEQHFDVVCSAAGTGATVAGLAVSLKEGQELLCFPALKDSGFINDNIQTFINECGVRPVSEPKWKMITDYHFGGFAKMKPELYQFVEEFKARTGIPLDPIYNGKMMFGIYDMISKGYFAKGTTILTIHTGGLQGWQGMKYRKQV